MKKKIFIPLLVVTLLALMAALAGCKWLFGGGGDKEKEKVSMSEVNLIYSPFDDAKTYSYTGNPITVEKDVMINAPDNSKRVGNEYFDFQYTNNINAGTATVQISANENNEYYYGSAEFHFTITKGAVIALDAETLIKELKGDNVYQITVAGNVDLGGEELTVKEGVKLVVATSNSTSSGYQRSFTVGGKLINNGEIELQGTTSYFGEINFFNDGEIINNGTFTAGSSAVIFNAGTFTNHGTFTMTGVSYKIYTNGASIVNVLDSNGNPAKQTVRTLIAKENIRLSFTSVVYSPNSNNNKPTYEIFTSEGGKDYILPTVAYRNYDRAGTAYIDITVGRLDEFFYGSITIEYEIKKASVAVVSVEQLHEYAATGNYGTFTASKFTIEEGETLTIPEDTEFYVDVLYVQGTLVNNGKIVIPGSPTSTVLLKGYLFVNDNNSGAGSIENNGTIELERLALYANGNFVNRGVIKADMASLQSPFTNEAGAELTVNGNVNFVHRFVNKGEFLARPSGYVMIEPLSGGTNAIVNSGRMTIEGDIVCRNMSEFSNSGTFENSGTVWSYIELPTDFKNVVVKRQITAEDIVIEGGFPTYDGTAKPAVLAESTGLEAGQYRIEYAYEGEKPTTTAPVDAGKMTLTVRITDERTKYYCSLSAQDDRGILTGIPYEILRAERGISTAQELYDYASNVNYARLYLESNIVFSSAKTGSKYNTVTYNLSIAKGVVVDTNGHTLTVEYVSGESPYVFNRGTILNSKIVHYPDGFEPTWADCGVILKQATVSNYGTIINNNLFYVDRNSKLNEQEGSKIENGGIMYLTACLSERTELVNSGTIYERENLSSISNDKARVGLEYWEADYIGQELFPEAYLFDREGKSVDLTNSNRFLVETTNIVANRLCGVRINAIDDFDKQFYGFCSMFVNVKKSVAKVGNIDALITATNDENYIGYELTASFALNKNVTVPANTVLDLGLYEFSSYATNCTVNMSSGAELRVSVDSMAKFLKYVYVADKITFTADILEETAQTITLQSSTMGKVGSATPFTKKYNSITIDLNGHYVGGQLSIENRYDPEIPVAYAYYTMNFIDTSENKAGQLGKAGATHGLNVTGYTAMYLNLTDIKVGGLSLTRTVYTKAVNCTFTTESTSGNTRAAYYCGNDGNNNVQAVFENCSFSGQAGAYLYRSKHIFRNCNITATGAYSATGDWGSAIVINGNNVNVGIDGGNFSSQYGYCVEFIGVNAINTKNNEITTRTNIGGDAGSDATGRWACGQSSKLKDAVYTLVDTLSGFNMRV